MDESNKLTDEDVLLWAERYRRFLHGQQPPIEERLAALEKKHADLAFFVNALANNLGRTLDLAKIQLATLNDRQREWNKETQ